jgi:rhodanese-related sulfurtransferase
MRCLLLPIMLCCCLAGLAQYKNDNVLFKTVFVEDLCGQLKSNPNAVLLDVRSKGEYEDTSTFYSLNIGRLKNTIHLDINEMPARWRELTPYKDKPLYVMCSHSQRSRRVSKMLADSGFTNIINVNGGLTTYNLLFNAANACGLYESHNAYKLISPLNLCEFISGNKNLFILDVRNDSAFRGISTDERQNVLGTINGSVNIPLAMLKTSTANVPAGKKILIVDNLGADAAQAAGILASKGYTDVNVLFNGLEMLEGLGANCMNKTVKSTVKYKILPADDFDALMHKRNDVVLVDVRTAEEFNSQSKTSWRNVGHIRNAVNIPLAELDQHAGSLAKDKPIVVYHFSSGSPDPYTAAKKLTDIGYTNVYVLQTGVFGLRWRAANIKGKSHLKDYVIDVPADNL